ncbi:MBL fold metallo-hydrolase [Rhizomonospora bruguierae]|uniref:MBL fold metallo-hydrolase n=1 Tax=Rhizomonospora bruguierae TaxID=1581705 RepID=UPI001BCE4F5E|nr:MBL fold metallo-hydrolase [Micromonospora sp. NBRC 107566]
MATDTVTFIGTATTLLRLGPFTLLTDPNFLHAGQRVHLGYGLMSKRRTEPALDITQLPPLDAVVLSHLHGDHFDRVASGRLARGLPIVTTPQAARRLRRRGFFALRPLNTWDSHEWRRGSAALRITATPGQHGPGPVDRLMPDVMGSLLDLTVDGKRRLRLYITGDTLRRPFLSEIPRRFPGIDAMLIHLGGARVAGVLLTMDAGQGADAVQMIRPAVTVPIHYDDYGVFRSPLSDFLREVRQRNLAGIQTIRRGETLPLVAKSLATSLVAAGERRAAAPAEWH